MAKGTVTLRIGHASNLDAIQQADTLRSVAEVATHTALRELAAVQTAMNPPAQTVNPAQAKRAQYRHYAKVRKHQALCASIAERSGWHVGTSRGVDPTDLALMARADDPVDTVIAERIGTVCAVCGRIGACNPDVPKHTRMAAAIVHVTQVLRDDSYSARRRNGVDTRRGISETDGKHGTCYRVNADGSRTAIGKGGKVSRQGQAIGLLD